MKSLILVLVALIGSSVFGQTSAPNTTHPVRGSTSVTQGCPQGQQRNEYNACIAISHEPGEVGKTYKDICIPAVSKDDIGHCDMKGYDIAVPIKISANGSVYVQTSVNFREPSDAMLDTGASEVVINDLPTTDEMKGAKTISATTAAGSQVKAIENELPVCLVVEPTVWLCQKTTVDFGGAGFDFLVGNSFTGYINRMIIDRRLHQIIFKGHTADSSVYLVIDGKLFILDNF